MGQRGMHLATHEEESWELSQVTLGEPIVLGENVDSMPAMRSERSNES